MTGYQEILYEKRDRVALISLNRPSKLNAWTRTMSEEMTDCITSVHKDQTIGAIILTGSGRAFCAGADISGWSSMLEGGEGPKMPQELNAGAVSQLPLLVTKGQPIIAAINGAAMGIGLTMALACDIRIAAASAKLSVRFIKVGLTPEFAGTRYLPLAVGLQNAMELALTGRIVDAHEAKSLGLIKDVVADDSLMDRALDLARDIASNPRTAAVATKQLLQMDVTESDLYRIVAHEDIAIRELQRTPEHREAVRAFMEKREPKFD